MPAPRVLILAYHAVSDHWTAPLSVTPETLRRQLAWLLGAGYAPTTFRQAVLAGGATKRLAVTFDDAYRSVHRLALPVLNELGIPGTVFAPTSFIGSERPMSWPGIAEWGTGEHAGELVPMSWEELGQLAEHGWEIGSHTRTHPRLSALDPQSLRDELGRSRAECAARLERSCDSLAYPYGDYDSAVIEAAREAGYVAAGVVSRRPQRPVPLAWPRVGVYHGDGEMRFRLKVSPAAGRIRASPVWRARLWMRRSAPRAR